MPAALASRGMATGTPPSATIKRPSQRSVGLQANPRVTHLHAVAERGNIVLAHHLPHGVHAGLEHARRVLEIARIHRLRQVQRQQQVAFHAAPRGAGRQLF